MQRSSAPYKVDTFSSHEANLQLVHKVMVSRGIGLGPVGRRRNRLIHLRRLEGNIQIQR